MVQLSALCAASRLQVQVVRLTTGKAQQPRAMVPLTTLPLKQCMPHHGVAASKPLTHAARCTETRKPHASHLPPVLCERHTPLAPEQVAS